MCLLYCAGHCPHPLQMSHACHRFWNCYKTLMFCSLMTRCTIPCAYHAKVLRIPHFFALLTSKCALRHNGMHFFDMSASKSAPRASVFNTFDLEMCFAPQQRTLFRHVNFRKWSEHGVLCTFWLGSVLPATTACTFSTFQLPRVLRHWCALYILTSKRASRHNCVQLFISHLARLLRTRHFSEPTFRPQIIGKTQCFATFLPFRAPGIIFLLTVSSLIFFLFLFSSLLWPFPPLLFICPYSRKFDF